MQNDIDLGTRLQSMRKAYKKSQSEIAEVLQTTQQQYWKYENNKQELPIRHLITLSRYYNVTTDIFLGLENPFQKMIEKEETEVLNMYRMLDDREKGRILERMQMLILSNDNIYGGLKIKRKEENND